MIKVGLTGGIGAGKSTVAKIFGLLNVPIFYADIAAKYIMLENELVKDKIIALLGSESYHPDGTLNKHYVASIIFSDEQKLEGVNNIVHPAVFEAAEEWFKSLKTPYAIKESALIFETNMEASFDSIICVSAAEDIRIKRLLKRDNTDESSIRKRLANQMSQEEKNDKADFVVLNDGSVSIIQQVWKLHLHYHSLSNN